MKTPLASLTALLLLRSSAHCQTPSPPVISGITLTNSSVPAYTPVEASISLDTGVLADGLPPNNTVYYDHIPPSYNSNLKRNEQNTSGISVDLHATEPDGTVLPAWPCYWSEIYLNGLPTGHSGWTLRGPTVNKPGTWSFYVTASDAAGTARSATQTFVVTSSASHGFVHVSALAPRYFEYSDGRPFIACGANINMSSMYPIMAGIYAGGGTGLLRVWIDEMGVIGGNGNSGEHFNGYAGYILPNVARTGRYALAMNYNQGFGPQLSFQSQTGTVYTISGYIKGVGNGTPAVWTSFGNPPNVGTADAQGWQRFQGHITATSANTVLSLGVLGMTSGHMLMDDVTITAPNGGDVLGGAGGFEWHTNYDQFAASQVDTMVQMAHSDGQFLKMVLVNKFDQAFGSILNDGTSPSISTDPNRSLGGSTNPSADTPVQRQQRNYFRYAVARWGAYPAVQSFEDTNEMDDYNGIQYAGAQAMAQYVHTFTRDGTSLGRVLCTSSTALNGGGITYDPNFYESTLQYIDIDFGDYHFYTDSDDPTRGPSLAYDDAGNIYNCVGSTRSTTGGPMGLGLLHFSLATQDTTNPYNLQARFPLPTLQRQGTWTVSYWMKRSADLLNTATNPQVQVHGSFLPSGYTQVPAGGATSPVPTTWTFYSNTFTVPDALPHQGSFLNLYGNIRQDAPAGAGIDFGDVKITDPDGKTFFRVLFNEPRMDRDSASLATYLAGSKRSYSGAEDAKPFVVGESELLGGVAPLLTGTTAGPFEEQAVWAEMLSPYAQYTQWWHEAAASITAAGAWKYEGAVEVFLADVPLSNGHYFDADVTSTPTLRVVGQKDVVNNKAVLWVQNNGHAGDGSDAANWYDLAKTPSVVTPVGGTITLPGLADGNYDVSFCSTATGLRTGLETLTSLNRTLTIPVASVATDVAIKVTPSTAPNVTLSITTDKTIVHPGDVVTYTLVYANAGNGDANSAVLTLPLPPGTTFLSATGGGTYDATTRTVTWPSGVVPAGTSSTVTCQVTIQ